MRVGARLGDRVEFGLGWLELGFEARVRFRARVRGRGGPRVARARVWVDGMVCVRLTTAGCRVLASDV